MISPFAATSNDIDNPRQFLQSRYDKSVDDQQTTAHNTTVNVSWELTHAKSGKRREAAW